MSTKANAGQYIGTPETGTLGKGKEAVNKDMLTCVCYNSGKRKWQKKQIHLRVYFPFTYRNMFMLCCQQPMITHMKWKCSYLYGTFHPENPKILKIINMNVPDARTLIFSTYKIQFLMAKISPTHTTPIFKHFYQITFFVFKVSSISKSLQVTLFVF